MNCFADKAPLIARCGSGKVLLHGAEKKVMLLGQLYVGPNSLWAQFVIIIVQFMYYLVLCSGFAPPRCTCYYFHWTVLRSMTYFSYSYSQLVLLYSRLQVHSLVGASTEPTLLQ